MNRRTLLIAAALIAAPTAAFGGANYDAALLAGASAIDSKTDCTSMVRSTCREVRPNFSGTPGTSCAVGVYVGREGGLNLTAVEFGLYYTSSTVRIESWTHCGDLEAPCCGWPASGGGNTVTWGSCQTAPEVKLVGFFVVTIYAGARLETSIHPTLGVARVLDCLRNFDSMQVPAVVDLTGGGNGFFASCGTPLVPTTWGSIKSLYVD